MPSRNTAYQYETSPRKVNPTKKTTKSKKSKNNLKVVQPVQRQEIKASKEQKKKQRKVALLVVAIFAVLLVISYRNSQINESFNELQSMKKEYSSLQKENEQLEVSIENSLNLNYIEQMAKEKLGMQKLSNKQTVYVNLPKKDYVESASEQININDTSVFDQITKLIFKK